MSKHVIDYAETSVPADYVCGNCGATNCKLWREITAYDPKLLCCDCAATDQQKDISTLDESGSLKQIVGKGTAREAALDTDQIGWYIPAVPTPDGFGYWHKAHVPDADVDWWTRLPLRQVKVPA